MKRIQKQTKSKALKKAIHALPDYLPVLEEALAVWTHLQHLQLTEDDFQKVLDQKRSKSLNTGKHSTHNLVFPRGHPVKRPEFNNPANPIIHPNPFALLAPSRSEQLRISRNPARQKTGRLPIPVDSWSLDRPEVARTPEEVAEKLNKASKGRKKNAKVDEIEVASIWAIRAKDREEKETMEDILEDVFGADDGSDEEELGDEVDEDDGEGDEDGGAPEHKKKQKPKQKQKNTGATDSAQPSGAGKKLPPFKLGDFYTKDVSNRIASSAFRYIVPSQVDWRHHSARDLMGLAILCQKFCHGTLSRAVALYIDKLMLHPIFLRKRFQSDAEFDRTFRALCLVLREDNNKKPIDPAKHRQNLLTDQKFAIFRSSFDSPLHLELYVAEMSTVALRRSRMSNAVDRIMMDVVKQVIDDEGYAPLPDVPGARDDWQSVCVKLKSGMNTALKQGFQETTTAFCKILVDKILTGETRQLKNSITVIFSTAFLQSRIFLRHKSSGNTATAEDRNAISESISAHIKSNVEANALLVKVEGELEQLLRQRDSLFVGIVDDETTVANCLSAKGSCRPLFLLRMKHWLAQKLGREAGAAIVSNTFTEQKSMLNTR